jgi:hypothetical protein
VEFLQPLERIKVPIFGRYNVEGGKGEVSLKTGGSFVPWRSTTKKC